jgi:hypothetical protein
LCSGASAAAAGHEQASKIYELDIYFVDKDKRFALKFPGNKTIAQVFDHYLL